MPTTSPFNQAGQELSGPPLTPRLPAPTGPHRVGVTVLHLTDEGRNDPWDPELGRRELMVSVFHPAHRTTHDRARAPQMTPGAAAWFGRLDATFLHPQLPASGVDWAATRSHAYQDAPPLPATPPRPVLLHSPGGGDPRTLGTSLAQDLASHGYVVVSVDHPGETSEVEFPGGRVRTTVLRGDPAADTPLFRTMTETRIADLRYVLDALPAQAEALGLALDLRRVGVYGHSAGGTAVAQAMDEDDRIGAAVDLEGYLDLPSGELLPVAREGVDRPLLLVGTDGFRDARFDRSWGAMLDHPGGRTRRVEIDGAAHWVFTDLAAMAPHLEGAGLMTAEGRNALVGRIAPERSVPLVRGTVRAFFDRHLGGGGRGSA
ncbi:alpha/beta hydrolase family protein [Streptomyces sp. NPDC048172]|uniref:alpha/beta hydrolase family protein n=1 Tax=Streptomyces sp. NPDC048172 TaxID=3365505 RepID=UPI003723FA61